MEHITLKSRTNIMNRKLVLICNPGIKGENYIDHVPCILDRYKAFFKSAVGGNWKDSEIEQMPRVQYCINQEKWLHKILEECDSTETDYSFIVFVGHGGAFTDGEGIQLEDNTIVPIDKLKSLGKSIKRSIIIDACRNFHPITMQSIVLETRLYSENINIQETWCEELYNESISEATPHIEIIQSTSYGQIAKATENGSAFSDAFDDVIKEKINLLVTTEALNTDCGRLVKTASDILPFIKTKMEKYEQVPQYETTDETTQFPIFAVWRAIQKTI